MACKVSVILLGYDDEMITDKHKEQINFTTSKIGGKPVSSTSPRVLNFNKLILKYCYYNDLLSICDCSIFIS